MTLTWDRFLSAASAKLSPQIVAAWLRPCRLGEVTDRTLEVLAPDAFHRTWLIDHHFRALEDATRECLGPGTTLTLAVAPRDADPPSDAASPPDGARPPRRTTDGLDARYTFETFVVGTSNDLAEAACRAVAGNPARAYNPLFLYGGAGLGKTHLLHAIAHDARARFPNLSIAYLSAERFTNDLIASIRFDRTADFRARHRSIDLLLIDDVQFLSGKERTQEEFFHTFNDLHGGGKQIVLSSDCSPKDIPEMEVRLQSRFGWGLIADIHPPDIETRVAILAKKAAAERVRLPTEVAFLVASRVKSNVRELEGSLTRMIAFASLTGRELTEELAHEVLGALWADTPRVITVDQVVHQVADFYHHRPADLRSPSRTKVVALHRQVAMYLARKYTHASFTDIGRAFGRDHTTVMYAVGKVTELYAVDPSLRAEIDAIVHGMAR